MPITDDRLPNGKFRWRGVDRVDGVRRLVDEAPTGQVPGRMSLTSRARAGVPTFKVPPLIVPGLHVSPLAKAQGLGTKRVVGKVRRKPDALY